MAEIRHSPSNLPGQRQTPITAQIIGVRGDEIEFAIVIPFPNFGIILPTTKVVWINCVSMCVCGKST